MSDLKPYTTEMNGWETTLLLSDEDAKQRGLLKADPEPAEKQAPAKPNKARRAPNKEG